jgi:alkanesulfonate monooxygenase SsuD/methylene tetrahydromethanopterin reductase-like flavin-dependent oxidoreductase (luciferase family)
MAEMRSAIHIHTHGAFADPRRLVELAQAAEECGWDGVFVSDHLVQRFRGAPSPVANPWIVLAAIAAATQRVTIGPMVTPLPRRRPWQLANESVTLDRLSNGRLILGLGSGIATSFLPFGEESAAPVRGAMLDEGLDVLTGLWRGTRLTYAGKLYRIDGVTMLPPPVQQPRIPIWIAGHWPHRPPFRRAARWDGLFVDGPGVNWMKGEMIQPSDLRAAVDYTWSERRAAGLSGPFEVAIGGHTADRAAMAARLTELAEIGATWWVEAIYEGFDDPPAALARVRRGPPVG